MLKLRGKLFVEDGTKIVEVTYRIGQSRLSVLQTSHYQNTNKGPDIVLSARLVFGGKNYQEDDLSLSDMLFPGCQ